MKLYRNISNKIQHLYLSKIIQNIKNELILKSVLNVDLVILCDYFSINISNQVYINLSSL